MVRWSSETAGLLGYSNSAGQRRCFTLVFSPLSANRTLAANFTYNMGRLSKKAKYSETLIFPQKEYYTTLPFFSKADSVFLRNDFQLVEEL